MKTRVFAFLLMFSLLLPTLTLLSFADEDGYTISISDGELLTKTVELNFFSPVAEGCAIKLDGESLVCEEKDDVQFCLTAAEVDYQCSALFCSDKQFGTLSKENTEQQFSIGRAEYGNGVFEIRFLPAVGNTVLDTAKVYGTYNIDDVKISNVAILLSSGERLAPKNVILHYPNVGKAGTHDETVAYDGKELPIGDGWNASTNLGGTTPNVPISVTFCFDVSDEPSFAGYLNGRTLYTSVDTTKYEDGEHTFTFCSADFSKDVTVSFDNTAPVINASIENGALLQPDDKITVKTDGENDALLISIDGKRYFGKEVGKFIDEKSNTHLLTVKSTDASGNSSYVALEFYVSCGDGKTYALQNNPNATVAFSEEGKVLTVERAEQQAEKNIFRVNVGENRKMILQYCGTSSEKDNVCFSVLNVAKNEYEPLRIFPSGDTVYIEYEATDDTIKDGVVTFKAEEYVYTSESDTMVWITDTQYYTAYEDIFCEYEADIEYYIDLYSKGEAGFLLHTGDVADDYSPEDKARKQMKAASDLHKKLDDAGIPYGIVDGNHDAGQEKADSKYFVEQFGSDRFNGTSWFYGSLDNNTHHYDLVTLNGQDFLFLWLGYGVEAAPDVLAWAKMVLDKYPNRNAIIMTHSYLDEHAAWVLNYADTSAYNHSRAPEIWDNLVVPHSNVVAVFCGHTPGAARNLREVDANRSVWEILADYQFANVQNPANKQGNTICDGEGYLRLVSFADGKMTQKTYSPFLDDWNYFADAKDEFTVDLPLNQNGHSLTTDEFVPFIVTNTITGGTAEVSGEFFVLAEEFTITESKQKNDSFADFLQKNLVLILCCLAVLLCAVAAVIIVLKKKKQVKG